MGDQQIEYGDGRVWAFEASANCTSGIWVQFDGGKVKPTTTVSEHIAGVTAVRASAGNMVTVIMEGVVNAPVTGAAVVAGDLLGAGATLVGKVRERTWGPDNVRCYDGGVALETIANGSRGKIKLLW
jgi:predicted RNA-binding protein